MLFVAAALVLAAVAVGRNRHALDAAVSKMGFGVVVLSFALSLVAMALVMLVWRSLLIGLGASPDLGLSARVYFISQVGKYLPGSVWPVLAQMELGRRENIKRPTLLAANVLTLALYLAVGLMIAVVCLTLTSPHALARYWWAMLALPVLLSCLHPRTIPWVIDLGLRLTKRQPLGERIATGSLITAAGWAVVSWLLLGLHVYVLIHALGAHGISAVPAAEGGMAFAVVVGILAVPVPAGAGVRDAVLAAAFAGRVGSSAALAAALTSRVLLVGVDFTLAGGAALSRRYETRRDRQAEGQDLAAVRRDDAGQATPTPEGDGQPSAAQHGVWKSERDGSVGVD
jgi:uncharacterized membrane protein YbhN (UPF0104 family)